MAITHTTVKAPGDKVFAVADWNANHSGTATPDNHGNEAHSSVFITGADVPANETDPVYSAWIAGPPNVSELTNDAGYLTAEGDPAFSAWLAVPPNISIFTNDSGYITGWGPEADPDFNAWISGPPNVSEFTNDSGYLTAESDPVFIAWDKDHADLSNVSANQHHNQAHKAEHITGGGDIIDTVTTGKVGLVPALKNPNVPTEFLNGAGNWAVPAGGGGTSDSYVLMLMGG